MCLCRRFCTKLRNIKCSSGIFNQSCCAILLLFCPPGRCELYGDPHYISFQGVAFDFLDECTYVLVEERSPRYHLTIAVENIYCVPGLQGSCAKGIIVKYQNNIATLNREPSLVGVQVGYNIIIVCHVSMLLSMWFINDAR